ncbi:uncharacterized protein GIQ15_02550 [Arthroderma uncinatum]|uniref:uncharacterized protein n=1 Tax=Arthroderma uncinatum TaxID=74035 RepID=UPI00144AB2C0|nr:uncharacterized protein GIQ15_02550 [Arthroderma uncinatum]KAF3483226.1 hypothetical protein GIQ15_02550 [Arthroderma uncinatum]
MAALEGISLEYILPVLNQLYRFIPPPILQNIFTYTQLARDHWQAAQLTYLQPYILTPINALLNSPPDLFSILALLLIFFISLKVLDYARRVIMFWVMLVFRLAFWGVVLGGAWYVYTVGWEKTWRDAAWVLGLLEGFIQQLIANNPSSSGGGRGGGRSSRPAAGWKPKDQWGGSQGRLWR